MQRRNPSCRPPCRGGWWQHDDTTPTFHAARGRHLRDDRAVLPRGGAGETAVPDVEQSSDYFAADAPDPDGRDGADAGAGRAACRSVNRVDAGVFGHADRHDVQISPGNLVARRLCSGYRHRHNPGLYQWPAGDVVPPARHNRDARHAEPVPRADLYRLRRQADRPAVCPLGAEGHVANLAHFRNSVDHLHEPRDRAVDLCLRDAHSSRSANLRARVQPGRGPIARDQRDTRDASGVFAVRRFVGAGGDHVCQPLGLCEPVQHRIGL